MGLYFECGRSVLVRKKKTPERAIDERREATNIMNVKMNHL